jgi:hypothetical protein
VYSAEHEVCWYGDYSKPESTVEPKHDTSLLGTTVLRYGDTADSTLFCVAHITSPHLIPTHLPNDTTTRRIVKTTANVQIDL